MDWFLLVGVAVIIWIISELISHHKYQRSVDQLTAELTLYRRGDEVDRDHQEYVHIYHMPAPFSGAVHVRVPRYIERVLSSSKIFPGSGQTDYDEYRKYVDSIDQYIVHFDVRLDGKQITSLEELGRYYDGVSPYNAIIGIALNGAPLAKEKAKIVSLVKDPT